MLTDDQAMRIINALTARGGTRACPGCGRDGPDTWSRPDAHSIASAYQPGKGMPVASTVCGQCGFVRLHNLVALGLASLQEELGITD